MPLISILLLQTAFIWFLEDGIQLCHFYSLDGCWIIHLPAYIEIITTKKNRNFISWNSCTVNTINKVQLDQARKKEKKEKENLIRISVHPLMPKDRNIVWLQRNFETRKAEDIKKSPPPLLCFLLSTNCTHSSLSEGLRDMVNKILQHLIHSSGSPAFNLNFRAQI